MVAVNLVEQMDSETFELVSSSTLQNVVAGCGKIRGDEGRREDTHRKARFIMILGNDFPAPRQAERGDETMRLAGKLLQMCSGLGHVLRLVKYRVVEVQNLIAAENLMLGIAGADCQGFGPRQMLGKTYRRSGVMRFKVTLIDLGWLADKVQTRCPQQMLPRSAARGEHQRILAAPERHCIRPAQ